jgi:hypothetical protein
MNEINVIMTIKGPTRMILDLGHGRLLFLIVAGGRWQVAGGRDIVSRGKRGASWREIVTLHAHQKRN